MLKTLKKLGEACAAADLAAIDKFLQKPVDLNAETDMYDRTLLMAAIRRGHLEVIKRLVEHGATWAHTTKSGESALTLAMKRDDAAIIEYLASKGAPIRYLPFAQRPQDEKDDNLFAAIADWVNDDTPARVAAMLGGGANPNARRKGVTPLMYLAQVSANAWPLWKALLTGGADASVANDQGQNVLHVICGQGSDLELVKNLREHGLSFETRDGAGNTVLHLAAGSGYHGAGKLVTLLLDAGVDPSLTNSRGQKAIDLARGDVRKLMIEKTTKPLAGDDLALLEAVAKNDLAATRQCLSRGANPCAMDTSGEGRGEHSLEGTTALHLAMSRTVAPELAAALLEHPGIDVNVGDVEGATPLHMVLRINRGPARRAIIERLLALGADPSRTDEEGRTPGFDLHGFNQLDDELALLDLFCARGMSVDHRDESGETILHGAWSRVERIGQHPDAAGLVAMLEALSERMTVPAARDEDEDEDEDTDDDEDEDDFEDDDIIETVKSWLASKGAKYRKGAAPAAKASAPRGKVDLSAAAAWMGKDAELTIDDDDKPVALFDWAQLVADEENDDSAIASQIREYHIDDSAADRVEDGSLIPLAVVGMTGAVDSYEELGADGTLFVDMKKAKGDDAPVIYLANGDELDDATKAFTSVKALFASLKR